MNPLNLDEWHEQINHMHQRLAQLQQRAEDLLLEREPQEIIAQTFQELTTAFEKLQLTNEELHQQKEELSTAHLALEASRLRYQELLEFAPDGYLVTDTKGVIQEANRAATTLLNVSPPSIVGKPLALYVVQEERQSFLSELNRLPQVENVQDWEVTLKPHDKTPITIAVTVAAMRNQEGNPIGLRWLIRDMSLSKRTEEALQQLNQERENRVRERTAELEQLKKLLLDQIVLRTRAEEALNRREQEFRALVENAPDIITRFDRELRHIYVNPAVELATGLSVRDFIGKTHQDLGMPRALTSFWCESLQRVFETGSEQLIEFNFSTPNGLKYYQSRHVPELGKDGTTETILVIARDITTSKQAEAEIRVSEERFRTSVENMLDCFGIYSAVRDRTGKIIDFRIEYVNAAACENNRMTKEEQIGKRLCDLLPNHRETELFDEYCQVIETGNSLIKEDLFYEDIYGEERLKRAFDIRIAKLGDGFTAAWRDITERKQAEDTLRESEQRFRQLAENIDEVFWMVSPDSDQVIYVSPAYEEIWGRTCESLYQKEQSWLDAVHPEDRDRVEAAFEKKLQAGYDVEYRIVRLDGSIRWIRARSFPVQDAQGQVYRFAGIAEDITTRKQVEEEVYKTLQKERALNDLKSRFVSMTSHEFRTPLTTIQSSAELLERFRDQFSQEKQLKHLHRILTSVERMTQMLNEILILGQAEAGKLEFNPTSVDLVQLCRNLVEDLQLPAKNQNAIVFTGQCSCIPTNIDEKLLRQILTNLLSNAIKYSPSGSTVQFSLTYLNNTAIFQIQDQGIGIPPEDQERLFESFHRAKNVGMIEGTGLGLAIVKQCVDLHRGEITVESDLGKGTTFTVTLPLNH